MPAGRLIESIDYLPAEQTPRIPILKNTIVDVKCTDQEGHIFIVEMQMQWHAHFDKRLLYGVSKAYVQQFKRGNDYSGFCSVYGLGIINDIFEKTSPDWYHHFRIKHIKEPEKTLEGMELIFLELPKFKPQTFDHRKMGVLWLRFLKEMDGLSETIPPEFQENTDLALAVQLAQESAYTVEELEAYDAHLDAVSVEKTVRSGALAEGEKIGMQIGGDLKARIIAKNLIKKGFSIEDVAMITEQEIAAVQKVAEEIAQ